MAEYDGEGNLITTYIYAGSAIPTAMIRNGETYHIYKSHHSSPLIILNANGELIKQVTYDSYGTIIEDSNPAFEFDFGFTGGLYDKDTNLIRYGARDYHPTIGRWTAKEPMLFESVLNLYVYVDGSPINYVDHNGLKKSGGSYSDTSIAGVAGYKSPTFTPPSIDMPQPGGGGPAPANTSGCPIPGNLILGKKPPQSAPTTDVTGVTGYISQPIDENLISIRAPQAQLKPETVGVGGYKPQVNLPLVEISSYGIPGSTNSVEGAGSNSGELVAIRYKDNSQLAGSGGYGIEG